MEIYYQPKFQKQYQKLSSKLKAIAKKKENIFRKNPFDARLKTHQLHGDFIGFLAFSLNYKYRIIFDFADENLARFYRIGTHDIYR